MSSTNGVCASRWSKVSTHAEELGSPYSAARWDISRSCEAKICTGRCGLRSTTSAKSQDTNWFASRSITSTRCCEYWRTSSKSVSGRRLRRVQGHDARVVVVRAVHRPRAQPEHQPDHARVRIDVLVPDVRIEREPDAGHLRVEQVAVQVARDPLHQQRHLLVAVQQPALGPVAQRLLAHRAGVDRLDGRDMKSSSRFWCGPWLAQNTLSYLPAKALP